MKCRSKNKTKRKKAKNELPALGIEPRTFTYQVILV